MIWQLILRNKYHLIGAGLLGLAVAFFEKQGAIDYAADRVWEEADAMTRHAAVTTEDEKKEP